MPQRYTIFSKPQNILAKSTKQSRKESLVATEIKGIYGFCRKNRGVSQVVEEKSEGIKLLNIHPYNIIFSYPLKHWAIALSRLELIGKSR